METRAKYKDQDNLRKHPFSDYFMLNCIGRFGNQEPLSKSHTRRCVRFAVRSDSSAEELREELASAWAVISEVYVAWKKTKEELEDLNLSLQLMLPTKRFEKIWRKKITKDCLPDEYSPPKDLIDGTWQTAEEFFTHYQSMLIARSDPVAMRVQSERTREKSEASRVRANIKHDLPGGSREKQQKIRAEWASGKFSSRDLCAEQECAALGMSFSAARKALRNTADPAEST